MTALITIATFEYPHEAHVIKSKLESEDIYVFLKDELTVQADNFISNAIGGVKLQIKENDVEKALEVLKLFDIKTYEPLEPEKFVAKLDAFTKKIPFLGKVSLENRGVIIIIIGLILIVLIYNILTFLL